MILARHTGLRVIWCSRALNASNGRAQPSVQFQASDRSPAKTMVDAIPTRGRPKYDALRQLAQDLITARHGPEASDPFWNLLHMAKEKQAKGEQALLSACAVPLKVMSLIIAPLSEGLAGVTCLPCYKYR